jgi:Predicted membrane protein
MLKQTPNLFYLMLALVAILCLLDLINAPVALLLGVAVAQLWSNPILKVTSKLSKNILQYSIVGLGLGINLVHAAKAGATGLAVTVLSITLTLLVGMILGRKLGIGRNISLLISSGTAICGGSAIAAVAPVVGAKDDETLVSLATIFLLNAVALLIFPFIGRLLNLNEFQFGFWSAIAIHDTSSVVGAASVYGKDALNIATTIKLERSLWIVPVSLLFSYLYGEGGKRASVPHFIILFVVAMVVGTYLPIPHGLLMGITAVARRTLNIALFLIGMGLSLKAIRSVGVKPIVLGVTIWIVVGLVSLCGIRFFL